jgi:hypothetical protein
MATQLDPHDTRVTTERTRRPATRGNRPPHERLERLHRQRIASRLMPRITLRRAPLPGVSTPNIALAGLQLLIGYEWLVSGVDKVLLGTFPTTLPQLLTGATSGGRIPGFFAALLQHLVLPNAQLFGVVIEWSETLAGLGLIAVGLVALLRPLAERYLALRAALIYSYAARLLDALAPAAAVGAGLLGLSFFLLDGLPSPWFTPSIAYGGAIDTGLFLAVASAVLVIAQVVQARVQARRA